MTLTNRLYRSVRQIWLLVPAGLRGWGPVRSGIDVLRYSLARGSRHQSVYDQAYYQGLHEIQGGSFEVIADTICEALKPQTVIDVGSGSGDLLARLRDRGVSGLGLEYAEAGVRSAQEKGLDTRRFDILSDDFKPEAKADVCISMEVAEHLPASGADRYLDLVCGCSDTVVFTAATPGQGGTDHINEQPHGYWIDKFAARGYSYEQELSERWRDAWAEAEVCDWYHKNLMVFRVERAAS